MTFSTKGKGRAARAFGVGILIPIIMFFFMVTPVGAKQDKIKMDFYTIGTKTDLAWSQGIYEASEHIRKNHPEVEVRFGDNIPYAEFPAVLEARAQMGVNIFYTESAWLEAAQKVMPRFPNSWLQLTGLLKHQLDTIPSENVFSYTQTEEQGGFLAGVAAAMMTKTKKIGMIAGADYPDIVRTGYGLIEGAKSVNPDIEFTIMYTGDWVDVQKGYEAAKSMIESGADILWHYNDNAGKGIAKAAKDHTAKGGRVLLIGETRDQVELAPDLVLTSCRVDHGRLAEEILKAYKANTLKKEEKYFGIEEGWPVIAPIRNAPPEVAQKVAEVEEAIKSGELKVPLRTDPEALTGYRSH